MASVAEMETFTYIWKIENFSSWVQKRGERVKSPWFTAHTLDETKWRLDLYPRGIDNGNEICISCYLCRAEQDKSSENVTIGYEFEILGVDGSQLLTKTVESFTFKRKESLGWPDFKSLNEIFRDKCIFLPKDVLTVRCHMWGSFPENLRSTRFSAITEIGVGGCSFKWNIKLPTLEAPVHYFVPGPWRIELTLFFDEDENISLKIRKFGEISYRYVLLCKIALLDVEGISKELRQSEHLIEPKQEMKLWEFPPFIKKSKLIAEKIKLLSDDTISFHCEFSISSETETSNVELFRPETQPRIVTPLKKISDIDILTDDLKRLLDDKKLYDVKLKADNKVFHAHKALLSVRSTVFADLFDQNSSESSILIPDLTVDTMSSLLKFMYTGSLENLEYISAKNLFIAANKYKVQSLKDKCSSYLKTIISNEMVCEILILSDENQDDDLKSAALNFMREHTNEILLSSEWKYLIENNVKLATETLCKVSVIMGKH